jgi:hypothetical protein
MFPGLYGRTTGVIAAVSYIQNCHIITPISPAPQTAFVLLVVSNTALLATPQQECELV